MEFDSKKESEMFDKAAEYYDKFRPGYPNEIIEAMVINTGLIKDSKILEIGAGSGKATEYLKNYGFTIRCVEPGENLVKNGRIKFRDYPNISFECGRFEELEKGNEKYDVIFAAQSFHWLPQPIGYQRCAEMLKDNGYLAPFWNMYITYDNEADKNLLKLSKKYGGFADFVSEEESVNRIQSIVKGIEDSGLFETPAVYKHLWVQEYTAEEYYGFVLTGNRFLQLPDEVKEEAHAEIMEHANKFNGRIIRPYLCVLYLAAKK
ncbi:class I SAM-dependent methyltransferase [Anaerocolumna sp. MB42-C2]|uniref:class I SAM-dependent methyltransferase n=1 Tax=Anaerocolumna sp. MB42-C2 TaxID=3070997 RepID=UPI0027E2173A|nr:class I SAM-dependent methyltransferase [Anaerocolumna sp. MB42-C2]WMJ87448.1 class I SAM-dependent methyltransferase [Anaerocolumna sp. MB42-C2]